MYLIFGLIGLVIGGFSTSWTGMGMTAGFIIAVIIAIALKAIAKSPHSSGGSSAVFDGCLIAIILEAIFSGL